MLCVFDKVAPLVALGKQHGDTNCGFEPENKNTQLSSEKDGRGTKERDDLKALERHRTSLETMVTAVNTLKESIEVKKLVNGEDEESVQGHPTRI